MVGLGSQEYIRRKGDLRLLLMLEDPDLDDRQKRASPLMTLL
jgi:hypothetical protein